MAGRKLKKETDREIRLRGVSDPLRTSAKNIARHLSIDMSALGKIALQEKVDTYPDHIKTGK